MLRWDECRYLVPADLTVGQFVYVVRKRIKLSPEKAIFIFVKNILPPTGKIVTILFPNLHSLPFHFYDLGYWFFIAAAMMSAIYEENKEEDGFLYMTYSGENTFGICWIVIKLHLCE